MPVAQLRVRCAERSAGAPPGGQLYGQQTRDEAVEEEDKSYRKRVEDTTIHYVNVEQFRTISKRTYVIFFCISVICLTSIAYSFAMFVQIVSTDIERNTQN